ncbi:Multidrug resistance protein MdtC [Nymphon striatum]|nr:Multidrug resistance protein MdtC [Nymphon striatum]
MLCRALKIPNSSSGKRRLSRPIPGASAEEVAEEVSDVIENTLQQLAGIKEIKSLSSPDLSIVTVEFEIAASKTRDALAQKFTQMRAKISDMGGQLPPNALAPQVYDDFGDVYALYFAITGDGYSLAELHAYAKDLQRELVLVDGVSKIILSGMPEEVIYVEYAPARLTELGLTPGQIGDVLKGQNLVTPAGSIKAGETRLALRVANAVDSIAAIQSLVIANPQTGASFRLSDIAEVSHGVKEPATKLAVS